MPDLTTLILSVAFTLAIAAIVTFLLYRNLKYEKTGRKLEFFTAPAADFKGYADFAARATAILQPGFAPPRTEIDRTEENKPYEFSRVVRRLGDTLGGFVITVQNDEAEAGAVTLSSDTILIEAYGLKPPNSLRLEMIRPMNCSFDESTLECEVGGTIQRTRKVIRLFKRAFEIPITPEKSGRLAQGLRIHLARGQFETAAKIARAILPGDPRQAIALLALGLSFAFQKNFEEARIMLEQAARVDPGMFDAFYNLGLVYLAIGKSGPARDAFEKGLKIDPDNHPLHYQLGSIFENLGQSNDAILNYQYALKHSPNPGGAFSYSGMDFEGLARAALVRLGAAQEKPKDLPMLSTGNVNKDLARAVEQNNLAEITRLLDAGADANTTGGSFEWPILVNAAAKGNPSAVQLLLEKGADIQSRTNDGQTAIMLATSMGRTDAVKLLIDAGAEINCVIPNGRPLLHEAAYNPQNGILEMLIDAGADFHIRDNYGAEAMTILAFTEKKNGLKNLCKWARTSMLLLRRMVGRL